MTASYSEAGVPELSGNNIVTWNSKHDTLSLPCFNTSRTSQQLDFSIQHLTMASCKMTSSQLLIHYKTVNQCLTVDENSTIFWMKTCLVLILCHVTTNFGTRNFKEMSIHIAVLYQIRYLVYLIILYTWLTWFNVKEEIMDLCWKGKGVIETKWK